MTIRAPLVLKKPWPINLYSSNSQSHTICRGFHIFPLISKNIDWGRGKWPYYCCAMLILIINLVLMEEKHYVPPGAIATYCYRTHWCLGWCFFPILFKVVYFALQGFHPFWNYFSLSRECKNASCFRGVHPEWNVWGIGHLLCLIYPEAEISGNIGNSLNIGKSRAAKNKWPEQEAFYRFHSVAFISPTTGQIKFLQPIFRCKRNHYVWTVWSP